MFNLKKKKTKGVQGGHPAPDPSEEISEPVEWLEQHHRKTTMLNKSQTNMQPSSAANYLNIPTAHNNTNTYNTHVSKINQIVSTFSSTSQPQQSAEFPWSGDESDNQHNQMENLRSQFYTPDPQKKTKEYHLEQAAHSISLLKEATKSSNAWKKVDKHKSGCVVYQSVSPSTLPTHGDVRYPAFKGEHVIKGFNAQEVFSIVQNRKHWE